MVLQTSLAASLVNHLVPVSWAAGSGDSIVGRKMHQSCGPPPSLSPGARGSVLDALARGHAGKLDKPARKQEKRESLITHSIPATVLADMKAQTQNRSKPSTTRANRNPEVRELKALPSAGDLIVTGNEYDLGIAPSVQNQADIGLAVGALITTGCEWDFCN